MSKSVPAFINSTVVTLFSGFSSANNELREGSPDDVTNSGSPLFLSFTESHTTRHLLFKFDISSLSGKTLTSANLVLTCTTVVASPPLYGAVRRVNPDRSFTSSEATWNEYSTGNGWDSAGGDYIENNQSYVTFPISTGSFTVDITGIVQDAIDAELDDLDLLVMPTETDEGSENNSNYTTVRFSGDNATYVTASYDVVTQELLGKKIYSGPSYVLSDYLSDEFSGETPGNYGVKDDRNDAGGTNLINTRVDDPNSDENMVVYGANHVEFSETEVTNPSVGSLDVTVSEVSNGVRVVNNEVVPVVSDSGVIVTGVSDSAVTGSGVRVVGKTAPAATSRGEKIINI